tara:strand:+ start:233 stop:601 length:369 start_codon:yes stop_codon:yes gene_type:complete
MEVTKRKLILFINKFSLAWLACMIAMVRGDLSVLTFNHAVVASKTGTLTGIIVVLMSLVPIQFKYKLPIFMFIGCFIGDLLTHDTHYGYWWSEAIITALIASVLSFGITFTPAGKKLEEFLK